MSDLLVDFSQINVFFYSALAYEMVHPDILTLPKTIAPALKINKHVYCKGFCHTLSDHIYKSIHVSCMG